MSQMTSTSFHENTMAKEPMDAMPMAGRSQQNSQTSPAVHRKSKATSAKNRIMNILFSSLKYDGFVCSVERLTNAGVIFQVMYDERQGFILIVKPLLISEAITSRGFAPPLNRVVHIFSFHCFYLLVSLYSLQHTLLVVVNKKCGISSTFFLFIF